MTAMTREEMLQALARHGENPHVDYDDNDETVGHLGWLVEPTGSGEAVLSVTYEDTKEGTGPVLTLKWRMVPMGLPTPFVPVKQPVTVDFPEGGRA